MTLRIRYLTQTTLFAPPSAPIHQLKRIEFLHPTEICLHFKFLTGTARCSVSLVITHVHVSAAISVGGWKCVKVHRRRSAKQLVTRLSSLSVLQQTSCGGWVGPSRARLAAVAMVPGRCRRKRDKKRAWGDTGLELNKTPTWTSCISSGNVCTTKDIRPGKKAISNSTPLVRLTKL